jgi:phosphatidate cytidylyltransferase
MVWEWTQLTKSPIFFVSLFLLNVPDSCFEIAAVVMVALSQTTTNDTTTTGSLLSGLLLITIPWRSWIRIQSSFVHTVNILLVAWTADTGALVAGRLAPRPPPRWLARISPAKSLPGLVGGVASGTMAWVYLIPRFWNYALPHPNVESSLLVGVLLSVAAVLGDLWESSLKRSFGVKDSGRLLPGHGGVLDRFDSTFITVVLYEYYLSKGEV